MTNVLFVSKVDVDNLVSTLSHKIPIEVTDQDSNPQWTTSVANVLHDLGRRNHCEVWSRRTKENPHCHEWLCDIVWLEKSKLGIELAAESEWGNPGSVKDDFQKLLCIKAPVKVLLFSYKAGSNYSKDVWAGIGEYLDLYPHHLPGEIYIFMEFHQHGCRSAVVHIASPGKQALQVEPKEMARKN